MKFRKFICMRKSLDFQSVWGISLSFAWKIIHVNFMHLFWNPIYPAYFNLLVVTSEFNLENIVNKASI